MRLAVLNPCSEDFDRMEGDATKRFCATCRKHVHHLSEMTRDEAVALLQTRERRDVCVRFVQGPSGEIRFRPRTTTWRLGFVAAITLAMAACTGYLEAEELDAPEAGLVCHDADGFAVDCAELEYGAIPDAVDEDVTTPDVDNDDPPDIAEVPEGVVPLADDADDPPPPRVPPEVDPEGDLPLSCPIGERALDRATKTRKQKRRERRRARKARRKGSRDDLELMGVIVMGR